LDHKGQQELKVHKDLKDQ
jgi:hypothetical protein